MRTSLRRLLGTLATGWLLAGTVAFGQLDPLPSPLTAEPMTTNSGIPQPPGISSSTPANLKFDITQALEARPSTGPEGVPINLAAALQLAGVNPLDIAAATFRVDQALALLLQARALKIPNINGGIGYYRHDGFNQDLFNGTGFNKGTNGIQLGGGPTLNVNLTDAIYAPLAARRVINSRQADVQTARNDTLFSTVQSYFNLQETRGRLLGSEATIVRTELLVRFAEGLAPSLIAPLEVNRAKAQLESARQFRETTIRDWRVASAQLAELLLLDPEILLDPIEPPFLRIALIPQEEVDKRLFHVALESRPEILSNRELLAAAQKLLKREKMRPLLPNLVITTPGTANAGALAAGQFYTGANDKISEQGSRADFSLAAYWQLTNGGVGNIGLIRQRKAEAGSAEVEVTRSIYRVRSEVSQAIAQLETATRRVPEAELALKEAVESADKNFVGLRETTRPAGELLTLVVRPQEVVAALQVLNTAFQDYASAVNQFNQAQFALYRSIGQPAQWVTSLRRAVQTIPGPATGPGLPDPAFVVPPAPGPNP